MANTDDLFKASFGQHGCAFQDAGGEITAPSGMIIIAITMLAETTFTTLTAENLDNGKSFGLPSGHTGAGSGGALVASANKFPAGLTIFGRWTHVVATADADGGIICYFGPK